MLRVLRTIPASFPSQSQCCEPAESISELLSPCFESHSSFVFLACPMLLGRRRPRGPSRQPHDASANAAQVAFKLVHV